MVGCIKDDNLKNVYNGKDHQRREIKHAGIRHVPPDTSQKRVGYAADKMYDRIVGIGIDPRYHNTCQQDVLVDGQKATGKLDDPGHGKKYVSKKNHVILRKTG